LMARLHDKHAFAEFSHALPLSAPPTVLLESVDALMQHATCSRDLVFKPVYSRFAADTLIRPSADALRAIHPSSVRPWIAQQFVSGRELCSYGLWREGRLLAHECYRPKYRVGQGSGVYLDPVDSDTIRGFAEAFGLETGYTGQAGFDFIEALDGTVYVLECNPRATSGIHLFQSNPVELASLLASPSNTAAQKPILAPATSPRMISVAMALFAAPKLRSRGAIREFRNDWLRASDIVSVPGDRVPALAQILGLGEIYYRAIRAGRSALSASTQDIEWNGQPLGPQP